MEVEIKIYNLKKVVEFGIVGYFTVVDVHLGYLYIVTICVKLKFL